MRTLCLATVLVALAFALPACSIVSSKSCTADLRSYRIDITREVKADAASSTALKVEACVSSRCATGTPTKDGPLTFPSTSITAFRSPSGSMVANGSGGMTLTLQVMVDEGTADGTTPISIKVVDSAGASVHESTAEVKWNDDECHPEPESRNL